MTGTISVLHHLTITRKTTYSTVLASTLLGAEVKQYVPEDTKLSSVVAVLQPSLRPIGKACRGQPVP